MDSIKNIYTKFQGYIENCIFIVALTFYPLIKINQGLDIVDTSYSLTNFQYFPTEHGTWMVATYLANVIGHFLMQLPQGDTLIGIYFYTGLILSVTALLFYFVLRKRMPAVIVFIGEMIALGLCWCPTTILYNYLTYLLMGAGILLLHKGICCQNQRYTYYLLFAGVCLGVNVTVRMPNVVQASFIVALWYAAWLRKEDLSKCLKDTGICIAGYFAGFAVPFAAICIKYGVSAYPEMVKSLFAMTDKAQDYKPQSMLGGMFGDYIGGMYWLIFAVLGMGFLYIVYIIVMFRNKNKDVFRKDRFLLGASLFKLLCIAVCCVLIRFYWGRGMFNFQYYYYRSIYQWAVLFLILTAFCAVSLLASGTGRSIEDKTLALLILIQMLVTPLGSNNALYPMINNMFIAAPFTLWVCYGWFMNSRNQIVHFPWKSMIASLVIVLLVQSVGFHLTFVFNDGVWGEKRDTLATEIPKSRGIYTNEENAEMLTELVKYAKENEFSGRKVILYDELPGLSYFLDLPTAISTSWPDLDSYRLEQFEADMEEVELGMTESRPLVIVSAAISAYKNEDAEAYKWFDVDEEAFRNDAKLAILLGFLDKYDYEETFCNMKYAIYE